MLFRSHYLCNSKRGTDANPFAAGYLSDVDLEITYTRPKLKARCRNGERRGSGKVPPLPIIVASRRKTNTSISIRSFLISMDSLSRIIETVTWNLGLKRTSIIPIHLAPNCVKVLVVGAWLNQGGCLAQGNTTA